MTEPMSFRTRPARLPAAVVNVGVLYRRLMLAADVLPSSLSVLVDDREATVQVFARVLGDVGAIEAVWTLSGLLDERDQPRAAVSASGHCHFQIRGRLGGLPVDVVTVLDRPSTDLAA